MTAATKIEWADSTFTPSKHGPPAMPPRDGDKQQARQRINVLVRTGRLAHPNTFPCTDCGHVWAEGERRHEYDHHKGYAPEHHYDVEPVCTTCHAARDSARKRQERCIRGHEFTPENTKIAKNGTRKCRACAAERERQRGPRGPAYWAKANAKRKESRYGKRK